MTEFKNSKTALLYTIDPLQNFLYALKAPDSKRQYPRRFEYFLDYLGLQGTLKEKCNIFYEQAKQDILWTQHQIMQYIEFQKERAEKGEIAESTINNYYKSVKLFCEMNDIVLNWKKIAKGKPQHRDYANDRAPTIEEIKKLLEFPDRRIKVIILVMLSSGIRVGAWDYLKWKHIITIRNDKDEVIAAKIIVYAGTKEEYFSFITPEAFNALQEYIEFRASCGEKISGESWLVRDIWKSTNVKFQNRGGLATVPRRLKSSGIRSIIARAEWEQGIREPLSNGKKRHEFQAVHSFRKFFKSHCEQVMKSINVEILMGHTIGISNSYYKPSAKDVLDDYLKGINILTINKNDNNTIIEKEIKELREKNENYDYVIKSKLQERDDAIVNLSDQVLKLMQEVKELKNK
jgi:integrase